jgi:hypothetical protein
VEGWYTSVGSSGAISSIHAGPRVGALGLTGACCQAYRRSGFCGLERRRKKRCVCRRRGSLLNLPGTAADPLFGSPARSTDSTGLSLSAQNHLLIVPTQPRIGPGVDRWGGTRPESRRRAGRAPSSVMGMGFSPSGSSCETFAIRKRSRLMSRQKPNPIGTRIPPGRSTACP